MRFKGAAVIPPVVAMAAIAAGCGGSDDHPATAGAASKPKQTASAEVPGGRIAFRRYLDDGRTHGAVFTVNSDGSEERQLTEPPEGMVDDHPDWSPDGKRIAFTRCAESEPCHVFTVAAGGGEPAEVKARCELKPICDLADPAWTPDGRLLVTLAQGRERVDPGTGENWIQQSAVELIDPDSGRQRTILERRNWTGDAGTPAISPDGRTVIYRRWNSWRSKPPEGQGLFAVDFDGSHNRRLVPWAMGGGDHPGFAPDGTVLFRSYENDEAKQSDYWTVRPDGTDLKQLTHFKSPTQVLSTSYSADGEWIAYATDGVNAYPDVFVMRADGSDSRPVTRTKEWDSAPDWGPAP